MDVNIPLLAWIFFIWTSSVTGKLTIFTKQENMTHIIPPIISSGPIRCTFALHLLVFSIIYMAKLAASSKTSTGQLPYSFKYT